MTHEHKIGIGITCAFLCLTGAVIGLKMRDQPPPKTASETVPQAPAKAEKVPERPTRRLLSPAELAAKITPEDPNSKKEPKAAPGTMSSNSASSSVQANAKQIEVENSDKKALILMGAGMNSSQKPTTEMKTNDQTIKDGKKEDNPNGAFSLLSHDKQTSNPSTAKQSSEGSFQMVGGAAPTMNNPASSSLRRTIAIPEDSITKAGPFDVVVTPSLPVTVQPCFLPRQHIFAVVEQPHALAKNTSVPAAPDMGLAPKNGATSASPTPTTPVSGPNFFTPVQPSSPPPPPPPMPSIGTGATSPASPFRPGESLSPPPMSKMDNSRPAPLVPAAVPPAPTPSPVGTKPQADGSYFIQEPHSATNSAGGTKTDNGNSPKETKPAPLPLPPPLPGGADPGGATGSGSGSPGGNGAAGADNRPARASGFGL